jgi:hypothetical protein
MAISKVKLEVIFSVGEVTFFLIDDIALSKIDPKWHDYLGSHHWGKGKAVKIGEKIYKGTEYIPKNEIWISHFIYRELKGNKAKLRKNLFINMIHEYIERPIMRDLIDKLGFTRENAWNVAHPIAIELQETLSFEAIFL